jgi:hypothetical protein
VETTKSQTRAGEIHRSEKICVGRLWQDFGTERVKIGLAIIQDRTDQLEVVRFVRIVAI